MPEELTQVRMGKIVRDQYPTDEEDQEAVRQHAIAALNLTRQAKKRCLRWREDKRQHRADRWRPQVCHGCDATGHRPDRPDQPLRRGLRDPRQSDEEAQLKQVAGGHRWQEELVSPSKKPASWRNVRSNLSRREAGCRRSRPPTHGKSGWPRV